MRLFRNLGRKTLTSPGKVQIMALVTTCYQALILTDKNETFSQSWPEDTDISGEGADDDVSHCMLSGFESYG